MWPLARPALVLVGLLWWWWPLLGAAGIGETSLDNNGDPSLGMRELSRSLDLDETLQNQLVVVLDNNVELAKEIVIALETLPGSSELRTLATAYLSAAYPLVSSSPIPVDNAEDDDDQASEQVSARPLHVDIRSLLAQVRVTGQDRQSHSKLNFMHAVLASYLEDLADTFRYFAVAPGRQSPGQCAAKPSGSFLKCCPTCCPRCPCSPDETSQVHFERNGETLMETPAPPVNKPQTGGGGGGGQRATDDWWRSLEDLYPHKSVFGEREELLVGYLASNSSSGLAPFGEHEAYERWMRVLASLGEPVTREAYLAARTSNETAQSGAAMDARTIKVKLFGHLTRWARCHHLGTESGVECVARQRTLCVAPGEECPTRPAQQCTGCASCDAWHCPRPADAGSPPFLAPPAAATNYTTLVEPDIEQDTELLQGSRTCGRAPLNRGRSSELLERARFSQPTPFDRVINGQPQTYGEFPSYVFVVVNQQVTCGGTLVSDRHVLTAGHCISFDSYAKKGAPPNLIRVNVGEHTKWYPDRYEYTARVARVCRAPNYWSNGGSALFDWAILELAKPVRFNDYVQPACLPRNKSVPPTKGAGANCWLAGFGLVGFTNGIVSDTTGISPSVLQKVRLEQVSCRPWNVQPLDQSRVCFGRPTLQRGGSCRGDSGGPILCQDKKTQLWSVMALVSYGPTSCDTHKGAPVLSSVYADVLKQLAGIEKCMKG